VLRFCQIFDQDIEFYFYFYFYFYFQPTRTRVRSALEQNTTDIGPLDGSKLIQQMNDEELCEIFAQYPKCSIFYLKRLMFLANIHSNLSYFT